MKLGAYEYLLKPLELSQLRQIVDRAVAISRLMHVPAVVAADESWTTGPTRLSAAVRRCRTCTRPSAASPPRTSGPHHRRERHGKELIARAVYQHSRRAAAPFLAINCAAIPEQLLESELFGHEKGAFTGADRRRIGKFEQCSGGTIFLDEIGDMTALTQSKILRLLQDQPLRACRRRRDGADRRALLAATNVNLEAARRGGPVPPGFVLPSQRFTIPLPALRQRGDDLTFIGHALRPPLSGASWAARCRASLRSAGGRWGVYPWRERARVCRAC